MVMIVPIIRKRALCLIAFPNNNSYPITKAIPTNPTNDTALNADSTHAPINQNLRPTIAYAVPTAAKKPIFAGSVFKPLDLMYDPNSRDADPYLISAATIYGLNTVLVKDFPMV